MLKILNHGMRTSALAAAACAAVILVASPVSAATDEEGRQAVSNYRNAVFENCSVTKGKFKSSCIQKVGNARQAAREIYRDCIADPNRTRDECKSEINDYWVELAN
jgi:hypothetical protein